MSVLQTNFKVNSDFLAESVQLPSNEGETSTDTEQDINIVNEYLLHTAGGLGREMVQRELNNRTQVDRVQSTAFNVTETLMEESDPEPDSDSESEYHIKCPDHSISLREHHYLTMEQGIPNPLAKPILNEINDSILDNSSTKTSKNNINMDDVLVIIERMVVQDTIIRSFPFIISRVDNLNQNIMSKKGDPNLDDIKNATGDKAKQKKLAKIGITSTLRLAASHHIDIVKSYLDIIDNFVEVDMPYCHTNSLDIRSYMNKMILSEWMFYYLTVKVISMSKRANKSNSSLKERHTWLWDKMHQQVYYEIKKLLRYYNTPIAIILNDILNYDKTELYEIKDQMIKYPDLMFHSTLFTNIQKSSGKDVSLRPYQKEWIETFSEAFQEYSEFIIAKSNGEHCIDPKRDYVNIATMGSGKTTIASLALGALTSNANNNIHKVISSQKIVLMIIVPSTEVMVSFGTQCALDFPCIFVQTDHKGVANPIWMHKWCPHYKLIRRRKVQVKTEKWAEKNLSYDVPLEQKFYDVLNWHLNHKDHRMDWCHERDKYKNPDVIFCDPASAKDMLENKQKYYEMFGYNFFPVFDEFVATADCNIPTEKNAMLQTSLSIIMKETFPFRVFMSASVTKKQLEDSSIFENRNVIIMDAPASTNSLTQLFADGIAEHPFTSLKSLSENKMIESVESWDETALRCITPKFILKAIRYLQDFSLSYDDISSPQKYMETMKRFSENFISAPENIKRHVCSIKMDLKIPELDLNAKQLTITSGSVVHEVYRLLGPYSITCDHINRSEEQYIRDITEKIAEISKQKSLNKDTRISEYSTWNSEDFQENINNLEARKKHINDHTYNFSTPLGSVTVTGHWCSKYAFGGIKNRLDNVELAVVLSGLDLTFYNEKLDQAISELIFYPRKVIDSISSMYGRNDPKVEDVIILDSDKICGRCSAFQTFARAGRSGTHNCIVTAKLPKHLLKVFQADRMTALGRLNIEYLKIKGAIKIQTNIRRFLQHKTINIRISSIIKIQSNFRRFLQRNTLFNIKKVQRLAELEHINSKKKNKKSKKSKKSKKKNKKNK